MRAAAVRNCVDRRLAVVRGGPFLERGFGVARGVGVAFDKGGPMFADERFCGVEPVIEIKRTDQRFGDVTEDIVAVECAIVAGLFAEFQMRRNADVAGDLRAGDTRHETV